MKQTFVNVIPLFLSLPAPPQLIKYWEAFLPEAKAIA